MANIVTSHFRVLHVTLWHMSAIVGHEHLGPGTVE
jgi:hypothetical protein